MIELCEHNNYHCSICEVKFLKFTIDELQQQNKQLIESLKKIREITPYGMYHEIIDTALQQIQGKEDPR